MKRFLIPGIIACLLLCPAAVRAEDWETCHEALKELRVAARRASFETLETHRKEKQLTTCQEMNLSIDFCKSVREGVRLQRIRVESALAQMQAAIFRVELSCRQCMPLGRDGSQKGDHDQLLQDMCSKLKSSTEGLSPEERRTVCEKVHFPGDCSRCLGSGSIPADTNPGE